MNWIRLVSCFIFSFFLLLPVSFSQDTLSYRVDSQDTIIAINETSLMILTDTFLIRKFADFHFGVKRDYYSYLDTTIDLKHRYNPARRNFSPTLGNVGLAHQSLIYNPDNLIGFRFWRNHFNLWELMPNDILHYQTRIPYTELLVILGQNKEQYFNGFHTQNITKNWNCGFHFNKVRSEGFFKNQETAFTNAVFQTSYLTESKRYGVLAKVFYNDLRYRENGGITEEFDGLSDSRLIDVSLNTASGRRNSRGFNLKQYYNFSTLVDSVFINDTTLIKNYAVNNGFFYEISLIDYRFRYSDSNPRDTFYSSFPGFSVIDTLRTLDSTRFLTLNNTLGWGSYVGNVNYSFWLQHQYGEVHYINVREGYPKDRFINNFFIGGKINGRIVQNIDYDFASTYLFSGFNRGDFNGAAKLNVAKKTHSYGLFSNFNHASPDYMMLNYFSNHFSWWNEFNKTTTFSSGLFFNNQPLKLNVNLKYNLINNFTFFNQNSFPEQVEGQITIPQVTVDKTFAFKSFRLTNEIIYQYNNSDYILVPDLVTRSALYYVIGSADALKLHLGMDVLYFTSFYNYNYMPVTGQFFVQNESRQGNYPYLDFFVNVKVKQVHAFVKITHLNQGLSGDNFFAYPGYMSFPRAVRFGLNVLFFN
ncbi:MAG: hypothetical protein H0X62_03985 [Bacteroidetes bacterium]|nr:hypothetical protein [Bacteroidota bacterium]